VVRNGVDMRRFAPETKPGPYREQLGLDDSVPIIGLGVRPAPEKGLEYLAAVIAGCKREIPEVRVLIAGEFGWRSHYEEYFQQQGLGGVVHFLGHIGRIEEFFACCDLVIQTSKDVSIETIPNALVESMAMGLPVVSTDIGAVRELIATEQEGFLASPADSEAFAARVLTLLRSAELRRAMGSAGRARVAALYSDEVVMEGLARVLREVLSKDHQPTGASSGLRATDRPSQQRQETRI
jgi:glycosyltransferase involved in cell wall biosynthesis